MITTQDIIATVTTRSHVLTVTYMDGKVDVFHASSSWVDNHVLRLNCRDGGTSHLYGLPLANIRMWHRELT